MIRASSARRLAVLVSVFLLAVPVLAGAAGAGKPPWAGQGRQTTTTTTTAPTTTTTTTAPTTTTTAPTTTTTTAPTTTTKTVWVRDHGTSTAAVQAAADAAAGGVLVLEPIVYTVTAPIRLPSDIVVVGNGATLRTAAGTSTSTTSDGILDIVGVSDVEVSDLTFDGNRAQQAVWSQWRHAVRVLDASQVVIRDSRFVNIIGDGVYVSHRADAAPPYRCSSAVEIVRNTFTANHDNRNGVSLICGADVVIKDNAFYRMARPDMPGSIDMEPNRAEEFLEDIEIVGNRIESGHDTRASSGIVYIDLGASARVTNVSVHHNTIRGSQLKFGIAFYGQYERSRISGVTIWANDIRDIRYSTTAVGITVEQGVPATVFDNVIDGVTGFGVLTYRSCVSVHGNQITNVTLGAVKHLEPTC